MLLVATIFKPDGPVLIWAGSKYSASNPPAFIAEYGDGTLCCQIPFWSAIAGIHFVESSECSVKVSSNIS
ncbi:MAG: hypothetical protein E5V96_02550 [Mesorhizobium sp.]|nr:MAG: hypothetical protein E5V96_02550 [Mesorhizobium sp.]